MILNRELLEEYIRENQVFMCQRWPFLVKSGGVRWFQEWSNDREVTEELIQQFFAELIGNGKYHINTIHKFRKQLHSFFQWAIVFRKWEGRNPAATVRGIVEIKTSSRGIVTMNEYILICQAARMMDKAFIEMFCIIAWNTGMRSMDIAWLKWSDIHWVNNFIRYLPAKTKKYGRWLDVPMTSELSAALSAWKLQHPGTEYILQKEFVFSRKVGALDRDKHMLFKQILATAGIDKPITFHWFRHTFVTRLLEKGVTCELISTLTGQSPQIIMQYQHVSLDTKRKALAQAIA